MSNINEENSLAENQVETENSSKTRKYLIFIIHDTETSDLKLGINAEYVVEILNNYTLTYLPQMPEYVRGIFNMRGQIIPVMDMRLRLNKPAGEKALLVVLNYGGIELGILVDAVDRMLDIEDQAITTVPSQKAQQFVSGICATPDQSGDLMILDYDQLFAHE